MTKDAVEYLLEDRYGRDTVDADLECGGHAAALKAPAWPAHSTVIGR